MNSKKIFLGISLFAKIFSLPLTGKWEIYSKKGKYLTFGIVWQRATQLADTHHSLRL